MIYDLAKLIVKAQEHHADELRKRFVDGTFDDTFYLIGIGLDPFLKNSEPHEAVWVGYLAATSSPLLWKVLAL